MSRDALLPTVEDLRTEFKSDARRLRDDDLVQAAVCLANTEGGTIYLGVEKDGTVTGLHDTHRDMTGVAAMIANRTAPPLSVRASAVLVSGVPVGVIEVPRSLRLTATSSGTLLRRRLQADGTPECVPLLPYEFATRESDLRLVDYSALPVAQLSVDGLDPVERHRLRQVIEKYGGDRSLLSLEDNELDGALGLVRSEGGQRVPTVAGLLLIGKESSLREHIPTHEVAFQVMDQTDVRVNEFYRLPLVRLFERIEEQFRSRLVEQEVQVGLFRVPVPLVEPRSFREAVVNAITHRDYTRLGAVHIRWQPDRLQISNPGGFVEGVHLDNLLTVEPRPRNPALADAFKRIGLAERTGRGVDLIYQGLLRYGRPAPDYSRSDSATVAVELSCQDADLDFLRLVLEEERQTGVSMPVDALLVLSTLRNQRRIDTTEMARILQKSASAARAVLERLHEAGLVQAHGVKKGRTYTLSPTVYRRMGQAVDSVRQAGFDALQQEQLVLNFLRQHGSIRRSEVARLCSLSADQAKRLLRQLIERGLLVRRGAHRGTYYERVENDARP